VYPPNGTSEDLLSILARGCSPQGRTPAGPLLRAWEDAWVLAGMGVGACFRAAPPPLAGVLQDRLFLGMEGWRQLPFDGGSAALGQASALLERTSRPPSLLCLLSHPPVREGEWDLNVELSRHAMKGLLRLRPSGRPRVVNAVDGFALDMLRPYERGFYSGFMDFCHMGIDRLAGLRAPLGRLLLGAASWTTASLRLSGALRSGRELVMVLGGGVPSTGRVMYCAREFLHRLREERPGPKARPGEVLGRLERLSEGFARFKASGETGKGLRRSAWRLLEAWVLSVLARREALPEAEQGARTPESLSALALCARALGWPDDEAGLALAAFAEDFAFETSPRERFFRFIGRRVAAKGTPVLLLPLTHGHEGGPRIRFGEPVLLAGASAAGLSVVQAGGQSRDIPYRDFSRSFVRSRFR
jgi:hypothetical protein